MSRCHSSPLPRRDYRFDSTGVRVPVNAFFLIFFVWLLSRDDGPQLANVLCAVYQYQLLSLLTLFTTIRNDQ
ncbi:hypothetical protein BCV70DRAFT_109831 [Testicularia cyperi]|uniref:Uncharacterized protein n=1 Tax=Testicularia cyperi TaxID=1882483 RepID=A0A317XP38_9BASI|nr:hypothetical protein BCV70DRAFT_109831 [Testicularia cyperi]